MFIPGQNVIIVLKSGRTTTGVINCEFEDMVGSEILYWVDVENDCNLYTEDDLLSWNPIVELNCTCGANATYSPHPPPGHSYHCELIGIK